MLIYQSTDNIARHVARTPSAAQPTTSASSQHTRSSSSGASLQHPSAPPPSSPWDSNQSHGSYLLTLLTHSQPGQGGTADQDVRDLRAELLAAEAAHQAKLHGRPVPSTGDDETTSASHGTKRLLEAGSSAAGEVNEDPEAKRRRILEETRDIDADDSDSSGGGSDKAGGNGADDDDDDDDSDSDSDDSDEEAELQRELARVKRERQEKREREEREAAAAEAEEREKEIAKGNPLLNKPDFTVKRRWDDDVVFKNQARGTEEKGRSKEFVNDMLRSDFHKRFMSKYVR